MNNQEYKNTVGNGVYDAGARELIASDAVLDAWLGPHSLAELLPDLDLVSTTRAFGLSRVFPIDADPTFANVEVIALQAKQRNWRLLRIEIAPTQTDSGQYRDAVTGLPDRRALETHRAQWQSESIEGQVPHALLFMDLDGFKQVNDQFGHAVGDRVLAVLADRWRKAVRNRDLVVRYGGDEFVVLMAGIRSLEDAQPILDRLTRVTSAPIILGNHTLEVNATIGVAFAASTALPLEELLAAADQAMYAVKRTTH